ncbi:MAG: HD family phosphohydrolase [Nitrospinota bacterium]
MTRAKNGGNKRWALRGWLPAFPLTTWQLLLGGGLTLYLTLLLSAGLPWAERQFALGDIAPRDIKAPQDFLVEEVASTAKKRQEAVEKTPFLYDLDTRALADLEARLEAAFGRMQEAFREGMKELRARASGEGAPASEAGLRQRFKETKEFQAKEAAFNRALGIEPDQGLQRFLAERDYAPWIQEDLKTLLRPLLLRGVVTDKKLLNAHRAKGISVREVKSGKEVKLDDLDKVLDHREAERFLGQLAQEVDLQASPRDRPHVVSLAVRLVQPTLTFNRKATDLLKKQVAESTKPVYYQVKKGEMIVREGARVSEEHLGKLKSLLGLRRKKHVAENLAGAALIALLLVALTAFCLHIYGAPLLGEMKLLALFCLLIAVQVGLIKVSIAVAHSLNQGFPQIPLQSYLYAIPFAASPMLAAILLGRTAAVTLAVLTGALVGLMLGEDWSYALVALGGGLVAALRWKQYRQRSGIVAAGLWVGVVGFAITVGSGLMGGLFALWRDALDIPLALAGGITTSLVALALLPVLEILFKVTTDMKLLELADLNHPLLRRLVVRAPGTYHHSIITGNLAEEAAEAIGANPLLARVGAYYHDIGKMLKPEYFVENQQDAINRHDRLNPSMSTLILVSHVKDGIELARESKLPWEIVDLIPQHHGTSLIRYFYERAKNRDGGNPEEVKEEDYRYPGPKPQTREAAILMLADQVEAAARALPEPTHQRIQHMVDRVINTTFADGQLDHCELTLRHLKLIARSFVHILTGIYHHRVEYPAPETERKASDDGAPAKPLKPREDRRPAPRKEGLEHSPEATLSG